VVVVVDGGGVVGGCCGFGVCVCVEGVEYL